MVNYDKQQYHYLKLEQIGGWIIERVYVVMKHMGVQDFLILMFCSMICNWSFDHILF